MPEEYLFISDCHLDTSKPAISANLVSFLKNRASTARFLYILGDLFEVWLGDDDPALAYRDVIASLAHLSKTTEIYFLAGNRDFLLGDGLAGRAGFKVLNEPVNLNLGGQQVVLLHGDVLCTDDLEYQAFRLKVRDPSWQTEFLQKPLLERQQIAAGLRADSNAATLQKADDITDTNAEAVDRYFKLQGAKIMIHGHTHRPCVHHYSQSRTRYVLGDWNPEASYLSWDESSGFGLHDTRL